MSSFVVVGANGQLGIEVVRALTEAGHSVAELTHADVDVADIVSVRRSIAGLGADVVINTAALSVEASEADPDRAADVNAVGAANVSSVASAVEARVVHISTDYVFDGRKGSPYLESDTTNPVNAYGRTKLAGEKAVLEADGRNLVVRSSGLYGLAGCRAKNGMNFVTTMLALAGSRDSLAVVDDEALSPTFTEPLARMIVSLIESEARGVIHATATGSCNWFEFAREIFALAGVEIDVRPVSSAKFAANATIRVDRPPNTALESERLPGLGIAPMSDWRSQLTDYVNQLNR